MSNREKAFPGREWQQQGMDLRDYFAAKAMQGLLARAFTQDERGRPFVEWVAEFSYEIAETMLAEREKAGDA